ncbi:lycopene cyclase domain-containing protein [Agromyces mariniharenae]|uniref:Lycopene cyclase domain-containing protein n=1 Tax=Agromyces mariniharenae TaxID=2604423 RepID=A0A5S4V3M3_9MICO|nr:lycopene cyclase domain-containing protein [Agromyces mariniharenae]TYL51110.1 lycopene cyclase domain-containing protein [Agromyces mariniharenae]
MTYSLVCLPFLAVAVVLSLAAARRLPRPARRRRWLAIGFAGALVLVLTGVFDSLMIAAGLFGYADGTRLGPTIGLAPIEDFAYPIVTVLLVPAIWTLARSRRSRAGHDED